MPRRSRICLALLLASCGLCAVPARQSFGQSRLFSTPGDEGFSIVGAFDNSFSAEPAKVSARFIAAQGERPAILAVTARMQSGWHTYAMSQPRGSTGGPQPTKIVLAPSPKYRLLAPWQAHPEFKSHIDTEAWVGLELREHEGEVTWFAPIEITGNADAANLEIRGLVDMQVCKEQCIPIKADFTAKAAGDDSIAPAILNLVRESEIRTPPSQPSGLAGSSVGAFQAADSQVRISGRVEPAAVAPGETARIVITADPAPGWHVYAYAERDDAVGSKETLIAFENSWGLPISRPSTDAAVTTDSSVANFPTMYYHKGPVSWTMDVAVPKNAEPGEYRLAGIIGYQSCEFRENNFGSCDFPMAARFVATLSVGGEATAESAPLLFTPASYAEASAAADRWNVNLTGPAATFPRPTGPTSPPPGGRALDSGIPYDLSKVRVQESSGSLSKYVLLAFIGGLILNLMPCVLPVIGLKVMSFVEQAGRSRGHAFVLNVWYALGIVAVFLLLGALAASIGLSWGEQFGNTAFNVVMASIVFAMALSLLGVWEVPIPGFFGSGAVQEVAAKEGPLGAFLKGAVTTVLATPCTAPFMATAIAWAVGQTASTTLIVFGALGLGMASPYLVVGVFPELLRFLPKPGAWMETFKQVSGFILLATVVFILSFMEPAAVVPSILLFVGIGLACWLVARTPPTAERRDRMNAWALSGAVALLAAVVSFGWLYQDVMLPRYGGFRSSGKEGWEDFSLVKLRDVAVNDGRTVIVDFSADWCFNCKVLERTVLETARVEEAIAAAGAVKLYADFTDYPEEIDSTIKALKSNGVPVVAIFPGDRPYEPIVFRDGYTKSGLIAALQSTRPRDAAATTLRADPDAEVAASRR